MVYLFLTPHPYYKHMEYLPLIGTVAMLNLLGAVSPGPDFVMTVKNSLRYSRRSGIFTGLGVALGLCVHLTYCAAGIGYIISKSIIVFSIIKFLGAGYLFYIGISSMLDKGSALEIAEEKDNVDLTRMKSFRMGFLTNVLNPKATLFFLSLFTFVISHTTPLYVILIISFIIVATAVVWFSVVSIFFTQQKVQRAFFRFEKYINRFLGGLLVALGIKVALTLK
ncbi:MAG: LysE family transporter [Bacteroidota bacterium]|nr:LysE family transporter [Bacteroidota bacterium]